MQIEQLAITTQKRNNWKAFDLGCRMAMTWWFPLYGFLLISTLPLFLVCNLLSYEYGMLLLWWLKPLFERGLLYIYSRQVFGQEVSITEVLKAWPAQLKLSWFASLTWRRLSTHRSFDLAVTQLEQLAGEKRRSRLRVLHQSHDDKNTWWTIICAHWEAFIILGLFTSIKMLLPESVDIDIFDGTVFSSIAFELCYNLFWYIAIIVIAPIYIGGGFAAYLNRRIQLEGWDIELRFKSIKQNNLHKSATLAAVLVLLTGLILPQTSWASKVAIDVAQQQELDAQNTGPQPSVQTNNSSDEALVIEYHQEIKQALKTILNSPPFNENETVTSWRWTGWQWHDEPPKSADLSTLKIIIAFIAKFLEVILWVLFIAIVGWLLWLSRERVAGLFNYRIAKKFEDPLPSFSETYNQQSLPTDIPQELSRLLEQGFYRQALSLLLVGSLSILHARKAIHLTKSMTESQCLSSIKQSLTGADREFMEELITTWINLAWAHRQPDHLQLQKLCSAWNLVIAQSNGDKQ